jgi:carbon-monoxide dehydrogenase medium subunit
MLKKLNRFEYMCPKNLTEAIQLLDQYRGKAKILAGGTDLLVAMKKTISPEYIINIKGIEELYQFEYMEEKQVLKIGALTTIHSLLNSSIVNDKYLLFREAASVLASPPVRNMATVGGNICNASPAADLPPPLFVLNASVTIAGKSGVREVPMEKFFSGPGGTVLGYDELVLAIVIPEPSSNSFAKYIKYSPGRMSDCAFVSVAALIEFDPENSICKKARIALGAVAETPIRALKAEESLLGKRISEKEMISAGALAAEEARPINDLRGSAWYRREIIKVLVSRALKDIVKSSLL